MAGSRDGKDGELGTGVVKGVITTVYLELQLLWLE
jgi:hypothetical protein